MDSQFLIEIATSDYVTTKAAYEGGADRIELCANLAEGGTTPSYGHIKQCREDFPISIYPIIRPRGGDFLYTAEEFKIMKQDIIMCKKLGCDGIVIGLLNRNGTVDVERTSILIELAYPMKVTFHRAFDRCKDPYEAIEQLIEIGCSRILTSGQKPSAGNAVDALTLFNKAANGHIIIMPGSGVRKENVAAIAAATGCTEFHSSLRSKISSSMEFVHPAFASSEESYMNNYIDVKDVQDFVWALKGKAQSM